MKNKIISILCICIFIVLCIAFYTVIFQKQAKIEEPVKEEEISIMYYGKKTCTKSSIDEEENETISEDVIYYDSSYAIVELESKLKYVASDYAKYEELKTDFPDCKDDYNNSKSIICNIDLTFESDSPINTWADAYTKGLISDGYTCN